jgi:hypothetical protein
VAGAAAAVALAVVGTVSVLAQAPAAARTYVPRPAADPVAAVNAFLDAFAAKDFENLPAYACSAQREEIAERYDPYLSDSTPTSVLLRFYADMTLDISDRSVTLVSSDRHRARVAIGRQLTVSAADDAYRRLISGVVGPAAPSLSPGDVEQIVSFMKAQLALAALAPDADVVEEGGWLTCSDPLEFGLSAGASGSEPTSRPATPEPRTTAEPRDASPRPGTSAPPTGPPVPSEPPDGQVTGSGTGGPPR